MEDTIDISVPFDDGMIDIPDYEQQIDILNKPQIPVGSYLMMVTGAKIHYKEETDSIGIMWDLAVNMDNSEEGLRRWNREATTKTLTSKYTYLGRFRNGKVNYDKGTAGTQVLLMAKALNMPGRIDTKDAVGRVFRAKITWETETNVPLDQARTFAAFSSPQPYMEEGVTAPKLGQAYADSSPATNTSNDTIKSDVPF